MTHNSRGQKVVYERPESGRPRRYQVEHNAGYAWVPDDEPGYRTLLFAKASVWLWNSLGREGRVVDRADIA